MNDLCLPVVHFTINESQMALWEVSEEFLYLGCVEGGRVDEWSSQAEGYKEGDENSGTSVHH
jgi:hypothetical protein